MDDNIVFNLYFPHSTFIGSDEEPFNITIREYQTGRYLSFFSGSLISAVSGSHFSDVGIADSYSSDSVVFNLTFNNNTYMNTGNDISYTAIVYNYYSGALIGDYSACSIGQISVLTIKDFIERPI